MTLSLRRPSPELRTAYPVSRHTHDHFLILAESQGYHRPNSGMNPKEEIKTVAKYFLSVRTFEDTKSLYCNDCDDSEDPLIHGHSVECEISQIFAGMKNPVWINWGNSSDLGCKWCHRSIDMGTPWFFLLDLNVSITLVLQCCNDYPYLEMTTLPWSVECASS